MLSAVIAASAIASDAASYIVCGDWKLEVNTSDTYLAGGYLGTDTEITFPEVINKKAVVGVADDFADNCRADLTAVTLPDSYTSIGAYAFINCDSLRSVNIPSSLASIDSMAFRGCTSLESVDLSAAAGLKSIPYGCFSGCSSLSAITLPARLTTILDYAFSDSGINSIVIPDSVNSIGTYCFGNCSALSDVELGLGISSVPDYAFKDCTALNSVSLPASLTSIGVRAFYNDTSLTSLYVPARVSSIGSEAFIPMGAQGNTLTIDCYEGTYAERYAYENYLNYTTTELVKGDVNSDGIVSIRDVTAVQLFGVDLYEIDLNTKTLDRVDVTGDYKLSIRDATKLQLFLADLDVLQ